MNRPKLALPLAVFILATFMYGAPVRAADDDAVKDAQNLVDSVRRRFESGYGSRTDVVLAEGFLLEVKFRAKQVTRKAYCNDALANLRLLAELQTNDTLSGQQRSVKDTIDAKREYYKLEDFCQGMIPKAKD
jgi:outer membrane protein TolC